MKTYYNQIVFGLISMTLFVVACNKAVMPIKESREQHLAEMSKLEARVYDYLAARKTRDKYKIWQMFTPEYKKKLPFQYYTPSCDADSINGLRNYLVENISPITEGSVVVWTTEVIMPSGIPTTIIRPDIKTVWVKINDVWYLDLEKSKALVDQPVSSCGAITNFSEQLPVNPCGR